MLSEYERGAEDAAAYTWFTFDPLGSGVETWPDAETARRKAAEYLDASTDDEIPDEVSDICWGRLHGQAVKVSERPDDSGRYDTIQEWEILSLPSPPAPDAKPADPKPDAVALLERARVLLANAPFEYGDGQGDEERWDQAAGAWVRDFDALLATEQAEREGGA